MAGNLSKPDSGSWCPDLNCADSYVPDSADPIRFVFAKPAVGLEARRSPQSCAARPDTRKGPSRLWSDGLRLTVDHVIAGGLYGWASLCSRCGRRGPHTLTMNR
jgi:hypothetical protein